MFFDHYNLSCASIGFTWNNQEIGRNLVWSFEYIVVKSYFIEKVEMEYVCNSGVHVSRT